MILAKQMSRNVEEAEASFIRYLGSPDQWNRYSYVANNPLKYVDPTGERIEIFGNEEERNKALQRIKDIVGSDAGKLLYVREENGHYYVEYKNTGGGLAQFGALASSIETLIDLNETVEFHVATTFLVKVSEWFGLVERVRTRSVASFGGGATLSREESLSGNVEIYVHPNAANITDRNFGHTLLGRARSSDRNFLDFYNDIVDAHEFGHAYSELCACGRNSNDYALRFENLVRERRKMPNRRVGH